MFRYEFRHAFRLLVREPGFTLAALLTLALGVGANVAVFAVVEAVLLRPLPYIDAGQLTILNHRDQRTGITKEYIAIGDYIDLAQRQTSFEKLAAYGGMRGSVTGQGDSFRVAGLAASPALFETLRVRPALGRAFEATDARPGAAPVMLLGYDLWQTRFGSDPHVVGRGVKVDDTEYQVIGVAPPGFRFPPNQKTEVIVPISMPPQAPAARKSGWTLCVARLKPGATMQTATAELAAISRRLGQEYPSQNSGSEYFAVSLRDALVGNTKTALLLMLVAVGVVLLIACANVANLLLARSLGRRREMAVRSALGAGRRRLISQLLAESLALAIAAGFCGVVMADMASRALVSLAPKSVSVPGLSDVQLNAGVLAFALGVSIVATLGFGLISALAVKTEGPAGELIAPARMSVGRSARRAASGLVIAEVALAVVLLIGAGLILRTFRGLLSIDPGFRIDRVMTMDIALPAERYAAADARRAFYQRAFAAVKGIPGVEEAGAAMVTPLTGNNWSVPFDRADRPAAAGERPPEVGWQLASGSFLKTMGIPLIAGRFFDERDGPNGKGVVIVSEAIQHRFFPGESAIGHEIKLGPQKLEIVGVVGNIRRAELRDEPRADLYFPFEREPIGAVTLFIRTAGDPEAALPQLQDALRTIEPNVALLSSQTMADIARQSIQVTRFALWLLGIFAVMALVLAAVGIYGIMSYVVLQRSREIGTRVALGANRRDILWLVMRQGIVIAAAGCAIGLGVGLVAARALNSFLFGITASDPATMILAASTLAVTTIAACYVPARRASMVDPARTLAEQ